MSVEVEKLEQNMAKLTIEVPAEEFVAALDQAYRADKKSFNIPGFRKGKAPRRIIQQIYGAGVFYEDAANTTVQKAYPSAVDECGETIVSRPQIDIVQIEEGKPFIFTAEVALKPEVTLGEYKGLQVEKTSAEVTDEEVNTRIDQERDQNARLIDVDDRPVMNGDIIKFDFEGTIDGVPFEGGTGKDYSLTIGSGNFIPGFEEQLIGVNIGEEKEVHVTFPEEYQAEDLKGRDAVFQCMVHAISVKELPDPDDEFAQDVSEFDTFAEYQADVRAKMEEQRQAQAKSAKEDKAIAKAVANAQMEIPQAMIDDEIDRMADDFAGRLQQQGLTMEQYLEYAGMTTDSIREEMQPNALRRIKESLVLEAVSKAENIEISDERLDEEIQKMADSYKMEFDQLKEMIGEYEMDQMRSDLAVQATVELITDAAVEVEPEELRDTSSEDQQTEEERATEEAAKKEAE